MNKKKPLSEEQLADARRLKSIYSSKRKTLGINQEDIAEKLGVNQSAVSHYLNGINPLNPNAVATFAKILKVAVSDISPSISKQIMSLAQSVDDEIEYVGTVPSGMVQVRGEAFLGVDGAVDMIEAHNGWLKIYSDDKDAYGLKVKGDSMWPRIQSGEFVVVEPNTTVRSGDEVFVRTVEGHNMIKIFSKTRDGDYQFSSINNSHKPITLSPDQVDTMHYVSAIVKPIKYVDACEKTGRALF
ncbi:helix-turn-helix transcriptional regulator [Proteus mirabilis]|nr:helix-turn-helix transcriptional regulator [Proteus mirabilis]